MVIRLWISCLGVNRALEKSSGGNGGFESPEVGGSGWRVAATVWTCPQFWDKRLRFKIVRQRQIKVH